MTQKNSTPRQKAQNFRSLKEVSPRNPKQEDYLDSIEDNVVTFGVGPAGTGKTYLAMYQALCHLWNKKHTGINRVVLTRPAVEAGERLGFLPGLLEEKMDPYMRPLYDAIYDIAGHTDGAEKIKKGIIEIAPVAFMRGRAQPLNSLVATPSGFKPMGDLKIGTTVIGSNGCPTTVSGVFPQGVKEVFIVEFSDGTSVECSKDHLWLTRTRSEKQHDNGFSVKTTEDMLKTLKVGNNQCNHEIPLLSEPAQFEESSVPIDPYLLGVLLGDGCLHETASITVTTVDPEIVEATKKALPEGMFLTRSGKSISYHCVSLPRRRGFNTLRGHLKGLGLAGTKSFNKFIPYIYKFNSVAVRVALLQGLLDTDGSISQHKSGKSRVQFYSTSERLLDDLRLVVQSLGGTATKLRKAVKGKSHNWNNQEIKHCRDCFTLDIRLPKGILPFRLSRKLNKFTETPAPQRLISNIEFIRFEECQCISVSAVDKLYATENFIITHNTFNNSFVILDEAQNCSWEQLKMVLTRLGENVKIVINGDPGQSDLRNSGLARMLDALERTEDIGIVTFQARDVERSKIVKDILTSIESYERFK